MSRRPCYFVYRVITYMATLSSTMIGCTIGAPELSSTPPPEATCVIGANPILKKEPTIELLADAALYSSGSNCRESLKFATSTDAYLIDQRVVLNSPFDADEDGDGYSLVVDSNGQTVIFDGRNLPRDTCIIEIHASNVFIGESKILYKTGIWPICDFGGNNDVSSVSMEVDDN